MVRRSHRLMCGLIIVALAVTVPLAGPAQADGPLRSGDIVGGYPILMGPPPCGLTPDCVVWLAADCDPRLTGRDPGVFTSIVDIPEFAGTERSFRPSHAWLQGMVELWSEDCRYLGGLMGEGASHFRVPAGAYWMSITAGAPVRWELW